RMIQRPRSSTLLPYTPLFRSLIRRLPDNASLPMRLEYTQGDGPMMVSFEWNTPPADAGMAEALAAAQEADVIIYVGGISAQLERSEEHTSELQSRENLVCRLL